MSATPQLSVVIPTFNNVRVLAECLESWRTFAGDDPVELIVVEDGCRDDTPAFLTKEAATAWGRAHLRWVHEGNVHELRATNRGLAEARAPLVMTWHDDMFLRVPWLVRELVATFERYPEIGLLCLCRGLNFSAPDAPIEKWADLIDASRMESTIGPMPWNWFRTWEVDGVIRPWVVRRACIEKVGVLDEAFVPTGWDESDLAFRIRGAGWLVATHGYERLLTFRHLGSSTFTKYALNLDRDLQNGRLFFSRWDGAMRRDAGRVRRSWRRPLTPASWLHTVWTMGRFAVPASRRAILRGEW